MHERLKIWQNCRFKYVVLETTSLLSKPSEALAFWTRPGFDSRGDNILIFAKISVDCRIYLPHNVGFGGNVTGGDVQLQLYVCLLLKQTSEAGTKAE